MDVNRWKRRLKEAGLYEWGQWQGRVKMIGVVEASIEIDGTVRGSPGAVGGFLRKWLHIS